MQYLILRILIYVKNGQNCSFCQQNKQEDLKQGFSKQAKICVFENHLSSVEDKIYCVGK